MAEMGSGPMGLLAGSLVMFRVVLLKYWCHSISMLRSIGGTWLWLMWHGVVVLLPKQRAWVSPDDDNDA
jgi:hypothetical protein